MPALERVRPELERAAKAVAAARATGAFVQPGDARVLRALEVPMDSVRVLIVGQDPYPTRDFPVGWSFAVDAHTRPLPASLRNIFRELHADIGCAPAASGDLSHWVDQGVLLLNRVLTVVAGSAGSMRGIGWEEVSLALIRALAAHNPDLVVVLWGTDAAKLSSEFSADRCIMSAHPSPLAAHRGFFGSRPFSRVNDLLVQSGRAPIDWCLPAMSQLW